MNAASTLSTLDRQVQYTIQPLHNLSTGNELKRLGQDVTLWNQHWIARGLSALETMAAASAKAFLAGNQISYADVYLVPQLYAARRFKVDLAPYPTLLRVEAALSAMEPFARAHADVQPDAVQNPS